MRMGSTGLLCATQTRAPHCSHSQLNDGVDGIGTSSTRGHASTSRNSKSGMYERYTRICFDLALNQRAYPHTTIARFHREQMSGMRCCTVSPATLFCVAPCPAITFIFVALEPVIPRGQEFPNEEVAREEARAVARDLSRNKAVTTHELLVVTDANGKVIHEEPLFR